MTPELNEGPPPHDYAKIEDANAPDQQRIKIKSILSKIGLDMIPVVVGILIALFINNLQQNISDRKLLASTLESLSNEFGQNKKTIEALLPNQQRFLDTLRFYLDDKNI